MGLVHGARRRIACARTVSVLCRVGLCAVCGEYPTTQTGEWPCHLRAAGPLCACVCVRGGASIGDRVREVKETSGTARQVEERSEAREKKTMGTEGRKDDAGQTARERDVSRRDGGNISTSARRTTRGQRNIGWQRTKTHRAEEHDVLGGRISGRGRSGTRTTTRR